MQNQAWTPGFWGTGHPGLGSQKTQSPFGGREMPPGLAPAPAQTYSVTPVTSAGPKTQSLAVSSVEWVAAPPSLLGS